MLTLKIQKEFMEWIVALLNAIIKELKTVGILSEDYKYFKHRFKNRKRKSHSIKVIRDVETDFIIIQLEMKLVKDSLLLMRKIIHRVIPVLVGIKSFFDIFNNKDNEIVKDMEVLKELWKDRYVYYIFNLPEDKDKFFKGTQFIAKTIDRDEWEVVYIKYGVPKDNKKRAKIENDMKRTTASIVQQWIVDHMTPAGESFESFEQAKYRLMNGDDDSEITIPQDEFKEEKKHD